MRDLLVLIVLVAGCLAALRRPWVGVMVWTWISLMSPHRLTWGIAYDTPAALMAAGCTLVGMVFSGTKDSPLKGSPVTIFAIFSVWITLSWLLGLDAVDDYPQWVKVMKINIMLLVTLALLRTKEHIFAMAWVCALSLGLLGLKGGIFTITSGGGNKVWGPPGSFIEDNNEFALALVITIPLLRFLQLQLRDPKWRGAMTVLMVLCAAAALGSQSRGGLLAIVAMTVLLWWRGSNRVQSGVFLLLAGLALVSFMPSVWSDRMNTINDFQIDQSALGRFSAWWNAWNLAFHYPTGVGFSAARPELFARYSPYGLEYGTPAAHSVYFQVLGNHGFIGLALYVAIFVATWLVAGSIRRDAGQNPETQWCRDLAGMSQVSILGFAVGGAFLSLSYFDLTFDIMVLVVLTRRWLSSEAWKTEPTTASGKWKIPGVFDWNHRPGPLKP